ncbi:MAG TPA: hypothetical protein VFW25_10375 [Silvibacterium sp.]|nr:hypothetical protein [Silvibacterium sp.]
MVADSYGAELLALSVSVDEPLTREPLLKDAVTPEGIPLAESRTVP